MKDFGLKLNTTQCFAIDWVNVTCKSFSVILQLVDIPLQQDLPFISILQPESLFYAFEDVDNRCANISKIIILSLNDTTRVKLGPPRSCINTDECTFSPIQISYDFKL